MTQTAFEKIIAGELPCAKARSDPGPLLARYARAIFNFAIAATPTITLEKPLSRTTR